MSDKKTKAELEDELAAMTEIRDRLRGRCDEWEAALQKMTEERDRLHDALVTERNTLAWLAFNWRIASQRFRALQDGRPDPYPEERPLA